MTVHVRLATYAAVTAALLLVVIKAYAWMITDSISMLSSLVDSALDALVSLVNVLAVHYALVPPDDDHRFGHTSAEDLASLFQALFISGSAIFVGYHAIQRFFQPVPLSAEMLGMGVMVVSMVLTALLVAYQRYVMRRARSVAIHADSFHYVSDIAVNGSVIVALLCSKYLNLPQADPAIGLAIALYILVGAGRIGKAAFDRIMDKEFDEEDRKRVEATIRSIDGVLGMHDLKTRHSGPKAFIQCHVEMDGALTLKQAHVLADRIEARLLEEFPHAEIILHQDPHIPGKKL
jgi:ferrous-iron efflux pump FieF